MRQGTPTMIRPITISTRRAMGATGPVRIRLRWSGESDGRVSGTLAFRADVEPSPSEAMKGQLIRLYLGAFLTVDFDRAAYIAQAPHPDAPLTLVRDLEDAGFVVQHLCSVPNALRTTPSLDALHQLRAAYVAIAADIEEATLIGAVETLTDEHLLAAAAGYGDADLPEAGNRIINTALTLAVIADQA